MSTSPLYLSRALEALAEGLPCQAIKYLIPYRKDKDALHLLAEAYYLRGQNGAAMTALSYLDEPDVALEACILGRQGLHITLENITGYYAAEISYSQDDYDTAKIEYEKIIDGPYYQRAQARLTLINLLTGCDASCEFQPCAWNLLEQAEWAKHNGELKLSASLYEQAWNYYQAMPILRAHAALGRADLARVDGSKTLAREWAARASEGYTEHQWGQEMVSLVNSQSGKRPLVLAFPL